MGSVKRTLAILLAAALLLGGCAQRPAPAASEPAGSSREEDGGEETAALLKPRFSLEGVAAAWMPDGRTFSYSTGQAILVADLDGIPLDSVPLDALIAEQERIDGPLEQYGESYERPPDPAFYGQYLFSPDGGMIATDYGVVDREGKLLSTPGYGDHFASLMDDRLYVSCSGWLDNGTYAWATARGCYAYRVREGRIETLTPDWRPYMPVVQEPDYPEPPEGYWEAFSGGGEPEPALREEYDREVAAFESAWSAYQEQLSRPEYNRQMVCSDYDKIPLLRNGRLFYVARRRVEGDALLEDLYVADAQGERLVASGGPRERFTLYDVNDRYLAYGVRCDPFADYEWADWDDWDDWERMFESSEAGPPAKEEQSGEKLLVYDYLTGEPAGSVPLPEDALFFEVRLDGREDFVWISLAPSGGEPLRIIKASLAGRRERYALRLPGSAQPESLYNCELLGREGDRLYLAYSMNVLSLVGPLEGVCVARAELPSGRVRPLVTLEDSYSAVVEPSPDGRYLLSTRYGDVWGDPGEITLYDLWEG